MSRARAFPQALSEFRDTEPGSLPFGALQLVIGTSAVAAPERAPVLPKAPVLLADARRPAEPIIARASDAHVPRGTQRHDDHSCVCFDRCCGSTVRPGC